MIIDAILALFASIFGVLLEGLFVVFVPIINLIVSGIEAIISIFVQGFKIGRIKRKQDKKHSKFSSIAGIITLFIIIGLIIAPKVMNQQLTLVAEDGYSLPFAAVIIHTSDSQKHERTDNAGNIKVPRFSITSITVKDPRYIEKTWEKSEIKSELMVERTVLGAGLDSLAEKFLKSAK